MTAVSIVAYYNDIVPKRKSPASFVCIVLSRMQVLL